MTEAGVDLAQASADLIDAFNEADWERFRGVLSPDTVYTETGTGRRVEGAEDYVTLCQGLEGRAARCPGHDPQHDRYRGPGRAGDPVGRHAHGTDGDAWGNSPAVRSAGQRRGVLLGSVSRRQGAGDSPLPRRTQPAAADWSDFPPAGLTPPARGSREQAKGAAPWQRVPADAALNADVRAEGLRLYALSRRSGTTGYLRSQGAGRRREAVRRPPRSLPFGGRAPRSRT
jgi:hypothetical protein